MTLSYAHSLPVILLLPVLAAVFIGLARNHPNVRETISLITGGIVFVLLLRLLPVVMGGERPYFLIAEPFEGAPLYLELEPLGMMFALIAGFLWIVTTIYSIGYMRGNKEKNQTRFYLFFAVSIAATLGVAFAGNLLTLFAFYEMLTLATFPLVTHAGTEDAKKAGRVYLGILLFTSIVLFLLGIIWTWELAGTLDFKAGGILSGTAEPLVLGIVLCLFFFGVGKAALMPFHRWLPAAMVAPTPVSALLHAVAVVKAGVFSLLKISVYVFGADLMLDLDARQFLLYVAGATILIASFVAMTKDNLKARLAYSTVGQLAYVTLGALLATSAGVIGSGMHIAMHAFGKITLFFCAGAIYVASKKTEISSMHGIGRTMPITMMAFFIASLSIIGLPPMGGSWSKFYLALGALEAGQIALLVVLMLSSLLNIAYLLPIPVYGFFSPKGVGSRTKEGELEIKEAPWPMLLAIMITALACLALFIFPEPLRALVGSVVAGEAG